MKTRNNQSNADETILNQSINRRSFVKRGAAAGAATVFGGGSLFGSGQFTGPTTGGDFPVGPQNTSLGDYCTYPASAQPLQGVANDEEDLAQQVYNACTVRTPWPEEEWLPGYQSVHPRFEIESVGGSVTFLRENMPNGKIGFMIRGGEAFQIRHSEILDIP